MRSRGCLASRSDRVSSHKTETTHDQGDFVAERDAGAPRGVVPALPGARARASAGFHRVRKRPRASARDVRRRHAPVRRQYTEQCTGDLLDHRVRPDAAGTSAGGPRAGRRRRAQSDGSVGRQSLVRQRQCRDAERDAARDAHTLGRRRAARHRVRRHEQPRIYYNRAPRPAPHASIDRKRAWSGRSAVGDAQRQPRRRLGLQPREPRHDDRRNAAAHRDAVRRYAARTCRQPRPQDGLRGDPAIRQPDDDGESRSRVRRLHHIPAVLHPQRPCTAVQQQLPGRPAQPAHERRGQARARSRPGREVQQVPQPLGGHAGPQLEQRDPLPAARQGRVRDQRRHARADGVLHRRRHHALQHGRQPGQRQAVRDQQRSAEPHALRRSGRVRRQHRAGQSRPDARHRHLRQRGHAAASEQAHRLQQARERAGLRPDDQESQLVDPARHGSEQRRRASVCRRLRLEQDRRAQHRRAREQLLRSAHRERELHQRDRRRPERRRARRASQPPVRDDALRQRREGDQPHDACAGRERLAAEPRAGERRARPTVAVRRERSPRRTAKHRAPAATSSATTTSWRGISAIPTTS